MVTKMHVSWRIALLVLLTLTLWPTQHAAAQAPCMQVLGTLRCDSNSGRWNYDLVVLSTTALAIDAVRAYSDTPGVSVVNGPIVAISVPTTSLVLTRVAPRSEIEIGICGYNLDEASEGEPFDCCPHMLTLETPQQTCLIE